MSIIMTPVILLFAAAGYDALFKDPEPRSRTVQANPAPRPTGPRPLSVKRDSVSNDLGLPPGASTDLTAIAKVYAVSERTVADKALVAVRHCAGEGAAAPDVAKKLPAALAYGAGVASGLTVETKSAMPLDDLFITYAVLGCP